MITDRIRKIAYKGHNFWQHDSATHSWELAPASYIRRLLRAYGFRKTEAEFVIREAKVSEVKPSPLVTRLIRGDEIIAYRVKSWVGERCADEKQVIVWLRQCGFAPSEVRSLFEIAPTLALSAGEVRIARALAAHGIRA